MEKPSLLSASGVTIPVGSSSEEEETEEEELSAEKPPFTETSAVPIGWPS